MSAIRGGLGGPTPNDTELNSQFSWIRPHWNSLYSRFPWTAPPLTKAEYFFSLFSLSRSDCHLAALHGDLDGPLALGLPLPVLKFDGVGLNFDPEVLTTFDFPFPLIPQEDEKV